MIKKYEIMYIVDQDVKEEDIKGIQTKIDAILVKNGGKIDQSALLGLKDFAYEINHKKKGYYVSEIVESTPEDIAEFERVTGIDKQIVRTLVINTEKDSDYVASVEFSKTDMTKFEEERQARRNNNFNRRAPRNFDKSADAPKQDAAPKADAPAESTDEAAK